MNTTRQLITGGAFWLALTNIMATESARVKPAPELVDAEEGPFNVAFDADTLTITGSSRTYFETLAQGLLKDRLNNADQYRDRLRLETLLAYIETEFEDEHNANWVDDDLKFEMSLYDDAEIELQIQLPDSYRGLVVGF